MVTEKLIEEALDATEEARAAGFRRSEVPEPSTQGIGRRHVPSRWEETVRIIESVALPQGSLPTHEAEQIADAVLARSECLHWTPQGEPSDAPNPITLEDLSETSTSLKDLIGEARSEGVWCCENGCGSGACETCPCCSAGWCVSGVDGVPEDAEAREFWLEVATEYNPVAAALRATSAVTAEPSTARLLAQGFTEGVNFIDDQPGPWGAGMVAGRAEAARRRAAVTEQGD